MPLDPSLTEFSTTSPVLATFSFQDIRAGEGLVAYYPATTQVDATTGYILTSDSSTYSNDETVAVTLTNEASYIKALDLDFDTSIFQLTQTFEGTCNITFSHSITGGNQGNTYLIFKIRKWDGTTETEIAEVQTENINSSLGDKEITGLTKVTIPRTNFAVGETLRLTMEVWGINNHATPVIITIKTDPTNRNGTATNPNFLKLNMPQRLDL
jgi:hypothetical protein